MFYVPLYFEAIRSRPALVFWLAALAQAVLWLAVPILFYAAPPGDLAQVLAIGHEFQLDADVGPPLAFWVAEIAYRLGGLAAVYALSQICIVATFWCVFKLASAIVGPVHGVIAVLLMIGISLFTVPTPDFGPAVLTMPLWAFALLHYWRAVAEQRTLSWYAIGCAAALILVTSEAALILLGLLGAFTAATERGRQALDRKEPWIVAAVLTLFLFAHLLWIEGSGDSLVPIVQRLREAASAGSNTIAWLRLIALLVVAHAGVAVLVVVAGRWPRANAAPTPALSRGTVDAFASHFVKVFALAPGLLATIAAVVIGRKLPLGGAAPLVVMSGIAVIVLAGESIELYHQRYVAFAWTGLLIVPVLLVPLVVFVLPWTLGTDLRVDEPAAAMGHFFGKNFQMRTGRPLQIVTGDVGAATLVALTAPGRPSVYFEADPARSSAITPDQIRKKGAVVVWVTPDTTPTPPPRIAKYFPNLVAEVPQTFERRVQGRLPLLRIGWAVIRPQRTAAAAAGR
jgi:Dolichyl-phosphate-mannose-protein mannosyltransferase